MSDKGRFVSGLLLKGTCQWGRGRDQTASKFGHHALQPARVVAASGLVDCGCTHVVDGKSGGNYWRPVVNYWKRGLENLPHRFGEIRSRFEKVFGDGTQDRPGDAH